MKPPHPDASHGTRYQPDDPLERIAQEHLRQREICAALDKLAALDEPDPQLAAEVLPHFDTLLARHVHEEENHLFPMLRARSEPGDDINETLDRLIRKHRISLELASDVREIVRAMARDNHIPDAQQAETMTRFAAYERRHLIVENAIVLPLARVRLTPGDLARLRSLMPPRGAGKERRDAQ